MGGVKQANKEMAALAGIIVARCGNQTLKYTRLSRVVDQRIDHNFCGVFVKRKVHAQGTRIADDCPGKLSTIFGREDFSAAFQSKAGIIYQSAESSLVTTGNGEGTG